MKLFIFFTIVISGFAANAQGTFEVKIILPSKISLDRISIVYNIGYRDIEVPVNNHKIIVKDSTLSKYVAITVYDRQERNYKRFFSNSVSGTINFISNRKNSFLENVNLENIKTAKQMGDGALQKFAGKEINDSENFIRQYSDPSSRTDSLEQLSILLENKSRAKQLEFIGKNNELYYSLWLFKYNFVNSGYYTATVLDSFFRKNLKNNFRDNFETVEIENILSERLYGVIGTTAPLFRAKDIQGADVDLNKFRGNYVILNFWAPWCAPCIKEMEVLRQIHLKLNNKKLKIVSINCDDDKESFEKAIEVNGMTWYNINNDRNVIDLYIKTFSLPKVLLIDPLGQIVYSRSECKDWDLLQLSAMLSSILE